MGYRYIDGAQDPDLALGIVLGSDCGAAVRDRWTGAELCEVYVCGGTGFVFDADGFVGIAIDIVDGIYGAATRRAIAGVCGYRGSEDCITIAA